MVKPAAFPLACRISSGPPKMLRQFYASKPLSLFAHCNSILGSVGGTHVHFLCLGPRNCLGNASLSYCGERSFYRSYCQKAVAMTGKPLPWLATSTERGRRKVGKNEMGKEVKSSWKESAERFLKKVPLSVETGETRKFERRRNDDDSTEEFEDTEVVNDPRWDNIRNRFNNFVHVKKPGSYRPEVKKWDNQENWGRKTWKEAKESTLPKIVGEVIYGVGPILAALSANRRELYALYVQEGIDLSTNNRKKKDKKGFEKILKMAEKIGLSQIEVSKHDLNMVADNRPHQGLVLDASPLEMVGIKELEPLSIEGEKGPLWLALDEVTDPQNLGAIIRSAYFFGAAGVVLCAKNSAPLSGVVSKASAGSLELMELRSCRNMMQFLESSAGNGWRVLGGSVSPRAVPLNEIVPGAPTILVLGSEGTGLRPLVERACTDLIRIPGNFPVDFVVAGDEDVGNPGQEYKSFLAVESLNVSVAAGVLLNHLIGSTYQESS